MEEKIVTSVKLNAKLWRRTKVYAVKNNKKLMWCVEEGLRLLMDEIQQDAKEPIQKEISA